MAAGNQRMMSSRIRSTYVSAVISTSLVLFLLGSSGMLLLNAHRLSIFFKENISLSVILDNSVSEADAAWVRKELDAAPFVRHTRYISKEQAAKEMEQLLGADFLATFGHNPLPVSIEANLTAAYANADSIAAIEQQLQALPHIREVSYQYTLIDAINKNINKIGLVMLVFIVLLFFISVVLINSTIRLSIYSKRFLINTMRLVGATRAFIRRPFLTRSIWQGIIAGTIAILLIAGMLYALQSEFSELLELVDLTLVGILFIMLLLLGICISWLSTYFSVGRFLRLNNDELYF
ncbi:MAG: permease-like cell division protein FtsX [Prevotellaceae bacterium]|jgi:cell division transport system permease protein|nr:permease-like cell division protein FtsX [Prevotellaceae bacterium]